MRISWFSGLLFTAGLIVAASTTGGCVTLKQGDKMQADITANRTLLEQQQAALAKHEERIAALEQRLADLEKILADLLKQFQEFQENAREKAAGTSVTLDQFKLEIQRLQGLIEEVRYHLDVMRRGYEEKLGTYEQRMQRVETTNPPEDTSALIEAEKKQMAELKIPDDKKLHFRLGREQFEKNNAEAGRRVLRQFVEKYAKDSLADDALYLIGESYYKERRYTKAINEFQSILDRYPQGDMKFGAIFMLGECFTGLGLPSDASVFYLQVKENATSPELRKKAEERLKKIKP